MLIFSNLCALFLSVWERSRTFVSNKMVRNRKYKIVFCTPALYSAGGVERVVTVKASYFAEHLGYDVTIIVTEGKGRSSFFPVSKKIYLYFHKQRRFRKLLASELMRIRPDFTISTLRREINFLSSINDGSVKIGELHVNRANYRSVTVTNPVKKFVINQLVRKFYLQF